VERKNIEMSRKSSEKGEFGTLEFEITNCELR
jgi:hypothetical protein